MHHQYQKKQQTLEQVKELAECNKAFYAAFSLKSEICGREVIGL